MSEALFQKMIPSFGAELQSYVYTVTGFYALFRHHLVTQAPTEVTCFMNRRHYRRADRVTPADKLRFIWVPGGIYAKPIGHVLASAEQSLCDFVWLNLRDGIEPQSLVTFRNVDDLKRGRLEKILQRYPEGVRHTVGSITGIENSPVAS